MARAVRIDAITKNPDGSFTIKFTEGTTPLQEGWGGTSATYSNKQAAFQAFQSVDDKFTSEDLMLITLAAAYKKDTSLGATFISNAVGKTSTIDLTGAVDPIKIG